MATEITDTKQQSSFVAKAISRYELDLNQESDLNMKRFLARARARRCQAPVEHSLNTVACLRSVCSLIFLHSIMGVRSSVIVPLSNVQVSSAVPDSVSPSAGSGSSSGVSSPLASQWVLTSVEARARKLEDFYELFANENALGHGELVIVSTQR